MPFFFFAHPRFFFSLGVARAVVGMYKRVNYNADLTAISQGCARTLVHTFGTRAHTCRITYLATFQVLDLFQEKGKRRKKALLTHLIRNLPRSITCANNCRCCVNSSRLCVDPRLLLWSGWREDEKERRGRVISTHHSCLNHKVYCYLRC